MNERIKELRKILDLTQQKFADRLKISRNTVATYETGKSIPSDAAVALLCREFHVSERWLRFGEGEMFIQTTRDEEIAAFVGDMLSEESETFKKRFISILARLSTEEWELLEKMALELAKKD